MRPRRCFDAAVDLRLGRTEPILPVGAADPYLLHELALELGMTVSELIHGRGSRMSAHELCVAWPAFFAARARLEASRGGAGQ